MVKERASEGEMVKEEEEVAEWREQIERAIMKVDEGRIDSLRVGQASMDQVLALKSDLEESEDEEMVLYVAIKVKRKKKKEGVMNGNAEAGKREELNLPLEEARSAKSRRSARRNWLRLVTTMRGVEIKSCQGIFLKDSYRRVQYSEEDLAAELRGEYVVRSPSEESEEEDATPSKRVTWREALEEKFQHNEDDDSFLAVEDGGDVASLVTPATPSRRAQARRQRGGGTKNAGLRSPEEFSSRVGSAGTMRHAEVTGRGLWPGGDSSSPSPLSLSISTSSSLSSSSPSLHISVSGGSGRATQSAPASPSKSPLNGWESDQNSLDLNILQPEVETKQR